MRQRSQGPYILPGASQKHTVNTGDYHEIIAGQLWNLQALPSALAVSTTGWVAAVGPATAFQALPSFRAHHYQLHLLDFQDIWIFSGSSGPEELSIIWFMVTEKGVCIVYLFSDES